MLQQTQCASSLGTIQLSSNLKGSDIDSTYGIKHFDRELSMNDEGESRPIADRQEPDRVAKEEIPVQRQLEPNTPIRLPKAPHLAGLLLHLQTEPRRADSSSPTNHPATFLVLEGGSDVTGALSA
ncbi:hypothetical protein B296_00040625 [Ensete ventricosum]|uniref:Uncharacterized protein n=1 Tax=Ensete ventricosum TaxID=4639 RepID=A0A426X838_ENSVE|nr:hypothetical protein B296_00040625 [Ensete ventricosum]